MTVLNILFVIFEIFLLLIGLSLGVALLGVTMGFLSNSMKGKQG